jgi:hypothetical protein
VPLVDLKGLPGLSSVGNDLDIGDVPLVSLDGLQQLTSVVGAVAIDYNPKLETLDGLDHVQDMGSLELVQDPALESLSGLVKLAHLGGKGGAGGLNYSLYLSDVPALVELGLHSLTAMDGSVQIIGTALPSFAGLENLSSVGGSVYIRDALQLESLDGLNGLTSVNDITAWGCTQLVSLRALASLESIPSGCLFRENTKLPTCEVRWLEARLEELGTSVGYSETDNAGICP